MNQTKDQSDKTLVVTGSSGFVGEKLVNLALARGFKVIGIDNRRSLFLDCQQFTINLINEDFNHLIPKNATIIHLASLSTDSSCRENPSLAVDVNLKATMRVLDNAKKAEAEHFIFASSEWVYPEKSEIVEQRETDRLELTDLNSLYAISKLVGESLIRTTCEIPYTLLRFGIVYGPRALPGSSVESLALKVFNNEEIRVGSAKTARRFIYVDDLVEGILKVVEIGASSTNSLPINLAGAELISLSQVVEEVNRLLNKSIAIIDGGKPASIRNPLIDFCAEKIGWYPKTSFSAGIQQCIDAMTANSKAKVEN